MSSFELSASSIDKYVGISCVTFRIAAASVFYMLVGVIKGDPRLFTLPVRRGEVYVCGASASWSSVRGLPLTHHGLTGPPATPPWALLPAAAAITTRDARPHSSAAEIF